MDPLVFYRIGRWALAHNVPLLPRIVRRLCVMICSADIPLECNIGQNVVFAHFGIGVVLNGKLTIEDNVIIYHGVTIGRSRGIVDNNILQSIVIGRNTLIGAHAVILAKGVTLAIGRNCEIGAGAVVLQDMPDNSIAVGNPARILPGSMRRRDGADVLSLVRT